MAKSLIPDPLARRHLVARDMPPARALAIADAYLAEERHLEAIDFLGKAGAGEKLAELRRAAVERGDAFLLRAVVRATGAPPDRNEWSTLARAAEAAGKERYVLDARRQAEREED